MDVHSTFTSGRKLLANASHLVIPVDMVCVRSDSQQLVSNFDSDLHRKEAHRAHQRGSCFINSRPGSMLTCSSRVELLCV